METVFITSIKQIQPYFSAAIFIVLYLAEHWYPQRSSLKDKKHDAFNITIGLFNLVAVFAFGYYFQQLIEYANEHNYGLIAQLSLGFELELLVSFLLLDCFLYWWHRWNHSIPILWKFHKFHHNDEKMNTTTAFRFHFGELVLSFALRCIMLPLFGVSLEAILLHGFILLPVILFHHSNIKLSTKLDNVLKFILVTPQIHRIHHSNVVEETNSNYSAILPYWDYLFNSANKNYRDNIKFGL